MKFFSSITISITIICIAISAEETRNPKWAVPVNLKGVKNLYKVSDNFFRSAQPDKEGMQSLKGMGIKTIISLRPIFSDKNLISRTGMSYKHIRFFPWHSEQEDVVKFLRIVSKKENGPFLIHCRKGSDRTGMMCAMYRIVYQGWSKEEALDEMINGGYGYHPFWRNMKGYIENADIEKIRKKISE